MNETATVETASMRLRGVAQIRECFRGTADARFLQTKTGECGVALRSLSVGAITLQETCYRGSLLVEGAARSGVTAILVPGPAEQPAIYCGEEVSRDQLMVYGQGAGHFARGDDRTAFQVFVPTGLLERALADRLNVDPIDFSGERRLVSPGKGLVRGLRTLVTDWYAALSEDPGSAAFPSGIENLEAVLLEELSGLLARDETILTPVEHDRLSEGRVLLAARDCFERAGPKPVFLQDLCREIGVSERFLQLAFKRGLGISPMKYLKLRRLHLLHERLKTSTPDDVSIKRATLETGLWRLTRYARDYKALFGELPSETARAGNVPVANVG